MVNWSKKALSGAAALVALGVMANSAEAQPAYGSYVGVGGSVGLSDGPAGTDSSDFAMVVSGRYRLLEAPVSLRAQAFLFGGSFALVPTVSYDFDLNYQTTAYVGAGLSIASGGNSPSPVGNKTSFVIQPGIDYAIPDSNFVVFGNAIFAFDAFEGGGSATAIQGGVGWNLGR
ncbi:MAG: hypothetical protein AAFU71_11995 [Cyanobacteria bacterium J06632_22]